MNRLRYWFVVTILAALTIAGFLFTASRGWTESGMYGLFLTLVAFALLLAYSLSMRDRDRRSRPIAR